MVWMSMEHVAMVLIDSLHVFNHVKPSFVFVYVIPILISTISIDPRSSITKNVHMVLMKHLFSVEIPSILLVYLIQLISLFYHLNSVGWYVNHSCLTYLRWLSDIFREILFFKLIYSMIRHMMVNRIQVVHEN